MTEPKIPEFKTACGGKLKDPSLYPNAEYKGKIVLFLHGSLSLGFLQGPGSLYGRRDRTP